MHGLVREEKMRGKKLKGNRKRKEMAREKARQFPNFSFIYLSIYCFSENTSEEISFEHNLLVLLQGFCIAWKAQFLASEAVSPLDANSHPKASTGSARIFCHERRH